ncbi:hypothetical protein FBULB1_7665 [Fusarium bulbicola]|nr:hypothetical protein FBULB1_7665 [Fusarium bulbicola]
MGRARFVRLELPDLPPVSLPVDQEKITFLTIAVATLINVLQLAELDRSILEPSQQLVVDEYKDSPGHISYKVPRDAQRLSESQKVIGGIVPHIWFICSGIGFPQGLPFIIHPYFTLGTTRENILLWLSLRDMRLLARDGHVGDNDQIRFKEVYKGLAQHDSDLAARGVERDQGRMHLQHLVFNLPEGPELGPEIDALAQNVSQKALRNVHDHVGVAYNLASEKKPKIGSCYGCKVTCRYAEPRLAEDITEAAKRMNFEKRNESWPCAEVLASWYCESGGVWDTEQKDP